MRKKLSSISVLAAMAVAAGLIAGCAAGGTAHTGPTAVYVAELQPMNTGVTGQATTGKAKLIVRGDTLTAIVNVRNAPPNIVHWQHFHGFKDGREASCPSPALDANGDGIVDLIETHPASGRTMVPFIEDPASMNVAHGTYPTASAEGSYTYRETIPLDKLRSAFEKAFGGDLDLASRVIYIHGVPAGTDLPASVASLGPIPAHTTLPIACGAFTRVR